MFYLCSNRKQRLMHEKGFKLTKCVWFGTFVLLWLSLLQTNLWCLDIVLWVKLKKIWNSLWKPIGAGHEFVIRRRPTENFPQWNGWQFISHCACTDHVILIKRYPQYRPDGGYTVTAANAGFPPECLLNATLDYLWSHQIKPLLLNIPW